MQALRTRYGDVPRDGRLNHTSDNACRVRMEVRMYSVSQHVHELQIATKIVTVAIIETETTVETETDSKNSTRKHAHRE